MEMTRSKSGEGWVVEITNMVGDCLEIGGVCGAKWYYSNETLTAAGINPIDLTPIRDDDDDDDDDYGYQEVDDDEVGDYLYRNVPPDKVLSKGVVIQ